MIRAASQSLLFTLLTTAGLVRAAANCSQTLFDSLSAANFSDPSILNLAGAAGFGTSYSTYNLHIPVAPCAVVWPKNAQDVSAAIKAVNAAGTGTHVQARSGGHSFGNYGLGGEDGGVVIWLEDMKDFSMDNTTWLATVGSGVLLGDLTDLMANNGNRQTPHGTCPQVGVGGHATIGGLGPFSRQHGPLLDQIVSVEAVTADGSIVTASKDENSDLLWAFQGAGGSFGVITSFVLKTYPLSDVIQYSFDFSFGDFASFKDTWFKWQTFVAQPDLDRKLASLVFMTGGVMSITGTYYGTMEEYEALGFEDAVGADNVTKAVASGLGAIENDFQNAALQLGGGIPAEFYVKSLTIKEGEAFTEDAVSQWFDYIDNTDKGTEVWFVISDFQGGATNDVAANATSYGHRDCLWMMQSYAISPLGVLGYNDQMTKFLDGMNDVIAQAMPDSSFGAYPGYVDPTIPIDEAQVQYWGDNYDQLVTVKNKWDPNNMFANPQSVGKGW